jgi:hypothetical protein
MPGYVEGARRVTTRDTTNLSPYSEAGRRYGPYTNPGDGRKLRQEMKRPFPSKRRNGRLPKRWLTDFPTGLSFSTARRRGFITSATLGKPLTRESLVTHIWHLSTPMGSGLFAARTPRLPRILHSQGANLRPQFQVKSIRLTVSTQNVARVERIWRPMEDALLSGRGDAEGDGRG